MRLRVQIDPAEIEFCRHQDGSLWELGSGGYGHVSAHSQGFVDQDAGSRMLNVWLRKHAIVLVCSNFVKSHICLIEMCTIIEEVVSLRTVSTEPSQTRRLLLALGRTPLYP